MKKRRDFLKTVAMGSAGLAFGKTVLGSAATKFGAKSYKNIIGANDRIHVAVIGLNGRGNSMAGTFVKQKNAEVSCVCDVDSRAMPKAIKTIMDAKQNNTPKAEGDCRKVL